MPGMQQISFIHRYVTGGAPWASRVGVNVVLLAVPVFLMGLNGDGCQNARPVGDATCLACHDGRSGADKHEISRGLHRGIECEVCHGPGSSHVRNAGRGSFFIGNPQRLPVPESTAVCATCHASQQEGFLATRHAEAGLSCHACHDVHREGAMLFSTPNRERMSHEHYRLSCAECHAPEVEDYALSRHFDLPQITCGACHTMHTPTAFTASPVDNRLCLQCHQSRSLGFVSDEVVDEHTGVFHPVDPAGSGASQCVKCHLPPSNIFDLPFGPSSHTLRAVAPSATNTALFNGDPIVPANSCAGVVGCHDPDAPGSGQPHGEFDTDLNDALQGVFDSIGLVPNE